MEKPYGLSTAENSIYSLHFRIARLKIFFNEIYFPRYYTFCVAKKQSVRLNLLLGERA